jgi:DNA polymerase type B, organellar and viral
VRHTHLLYRTAGDDQPSQIVALGLELAAEPVLDSLRRTRVRLCHWTAVAASGAGGEYGAPIVREGTDALALWTALEGRLKKGGVLWLFTHRASLLCSLLSIWRRIESGALSISGADHRDKRPINGAHLSRVRGDPHSDDSVTGSLSSSDHVAAEVRVSPRPADGRRARNPRRAKRGGYAVVEDPPWILDLKVPGLSGTLRIVDVANYGLEESADLPGALDRARRVFSFVSGMIGVLKSEGLGSLKATVASQSYYSFRRKYLHHLVQCHAHEQALRLESEGYYGGRCECLRLGRLPGRVWHLDVASMYPAIYRSAQLPVGLCGYTESPDDGAIRDLCESKYVIAEVVLDTGVPAYPYRDERQRIIIYPVGRFTTTLAGAELLYAMRANSIVAWRRLAWYDTQPFLSQFGARIWALSRLYAGHPELKKWIKRLGVCVVGKLGQREKMWVSAPSNRICLPWDSWEEQDEHSQWRRWRCFAGVTQYEYAGGWSFDAVPAAACAITAAGRMQLLRYLNCAGWNNVHYVDTDALMCNERGYRRLLGAGHVGTGEWGLLKIEGVYNDVVIRGIKSYLADGRSVCAGDPASGAQTAPVGGNPTKQIGIAGYCHARQQPDNILIATAPQRTGVYRHGVPHVSGWVDPHWLGRESYGQPYKD